MSGSREQLPDIAVDRQQLAARRSFYLRHSQETDRQAVSLGIWQGPDEHREFFRERVITGVYRTKYYTSSQVREIVDALEGERYFRSPEEMGAFYRKRDN